MDEILSKFENTLNTTRTEDELSHKDMYKNWGKYGNQEERRAEILRQQKSNRENKLDNCRGILNLITNSEEKSHVFKKSSRVRYQPTVYVPGFTNSSNFYYNILMLSEWMVEKPEDFSANWFMTPCPKATRTLVVASNGKTMCYSKYGQLFLTIPTLLPGGNGCEKRKNCSVLDCFHHKESNTMFVLDILSWNSHVMADGEMEFRRYWLETKFMEYPELGKISKKNKVSFQLLPMIPCDPDSIQKFLETYPAFTAAKLDGLLFYHRHGHYVAGETPLVGWLYPYMVPEVVCPGMTIHKSYEAGKPEDYVDQAKFIQQFEEKSISKKKKIPFLKGLKKTTARAECSMDADDSPLEQEKNVDDDITEQIDDNVMDHKDDIGPEQQGDIVPGPQGDVIPGQQGDISPSQQGDIVPGQQGDNATVQQNRIAMGPLNYIALGQAYYPIIGQRGDSASMEEEDAERRENRELTQVLLSSIFCTEDSSQRRVTKYYSYFN